MKRQRSASGVSIGLRKSMVSVQKKQEVLNKSNSSEFTVKVANTLEERETVFQLGYQVYLKKGFTGENTNEWLIRSYDACEETVILIVQDKNKNLAGSVTLVFDGSCNLPAEKLYHSEIRSLKNNGEKLVEISRLVISPEYRNSNEILFLLFNYLAIYCHHIKKYTYLTVQVNPRHKNYYKALLKFDEMGIEKVSPYLKYAPAVLLTLPISRYQAEVKKYASNKNDNIKERSLYSYSIKPSQELLVAEYLEKQVKPISFAEKMYFGLQNLELVELTVFK